MKADDRVQKFVPYNSVLKPLALMTLTAIFSIYAMGCSKSIKPETHEPTKLVKLTEDPQLLTPVLSKNIGIHIAQYTPSALQIGFNGDNALVVSASSEVANYNAQGQKLWSVDLETDILAGVSFDVATQTAVVTTRDAHVIALDATTGTVRWRQALNGTVLTPALIHKNRVVISGNDGVLRGLSLQTGESVWQFVIQAPAISIRGTAKPILLSNEAVLFATADGRLHALDVETGIPRWTRRVGIPKGASEVERMSDIDSTPVVNNNQLFAVSYSGQLIGIDLISREVMFVNDAASLKDLAVTPSSVIVSTLQGYVQAYDRNTGALLWSNEELAYRGLTNPVVVYTNADATGSYVVVGDKQGVVHVLQSTTGRIVSRQKVKGGLQFLQAKEDKVFTLTDKGEMNIWRFGR